VQPLSQTIDRFTRYAEEADARSNTADFKAKEEWLHIAASWRYLAERTLADRTGGEVVHR
jgi:hypothetical protein